MVINQGDVFWAFLGRPIGSEPGYRHPITIIQSDIFNHSPINTVVACLLTSKLQRAGSPGNVLLTKGEANLPKSSVVNISQIVTVDKSMLIEKIGTLSRQRVIEIIKGIHLLIDPREL
ncbi:type II toxin-antitoxin system PemK/MazF family toxin [Candidatus Desantisbacteria bacterium CG_4_10_14_0_8_um_filter_48_22]|uniref:mRNA interferase n=1 Tax=Candidatus Desantisbacteria bacterium CG_4_10_14_0_8_um_filter_48_22 TaxID=1974543 RepID=A0A2M7SA78_9BACT|nr:MAG: PemK family transcriptional regulator [Candidatus Desantisbacteria bacterium CG1_02_49_89]PIZ16446.1 MAG: type II toxin-antitoxin system PemK/MazF family toxin [Candidatus Desantisbacteria bacterium CG_4_10_14_0_8_um_filter_48_22]